MSWEFPAAATLISAMNSSNSGGGIVLAFYTPITTLPLKHSTGRLCACVHTLSMYSVRKLHKQTAQLGYVAGITLHAMC